MEWRGAGRVGNAHAAMPLTALFQQEITEVSIAAGRIQKLAKHLHW